MFPLYYHGDFGCCTNYISLKNVCPQRHANLLNIKVNIIPCVTFQLALLRFFCTNHKTQLASSLRELPSNHNI